MPGVFDCRIIEQVETNPGVVRTRLVCPEIARTAVAGQFVNVQVSTTSDPLLRRPFSVHAVDPEQGVFSLLYVLAGRGTALLWNMKSGDSVSVVGPLGRGFDLGDDPEASHIIVAGGCGAAPLHFLVDSVCAKWGCEKVTVLTGARNADAVLCELEFRAHNVEVGVSTDDGSYGYHGLVTELLEQELARQTDMSGVRVYTCGPHAMLKAVAGVAAKAGVANCQVSLENHMSCAIGVCMGCVQKIRNKDNDGWHYERVCKEGPVFNAEDVLW